MASETALAYEQEIKNIQSRVENQSATIDVVAKRALEIETELNQKFTNAQNDWNSLIMNRNLYQRY
jgi:hypothetical protein